jgi:4-amino-4-deoxy-L-arabinose transferase-like glycosyltransferase
MWKLKNFKGITLPPSGWSLAILLFLYLFVGLVGHDPWKPDDAVSIGVALDMFKGGRWLVPHLAGQPYPDAPLYYWIAAGFSAAFSWILPAHDAARLASCLCALLALEFILLAARELYGKEFSAAAPLTLAGSIGFLYHAHEAQPMLAALMAHAAAYWATVLMPRRPALATLTLGLSLAAVFLSDGLLPLAAILPLLVFSLVFSENRLKDFLRVAVALSLASALCALWLLPLKAAAPQFFAQFSQNEVAALTHGGARFASNAARYLKMLLWYAWPALPLAAWALWVKRRLLRTKAFALPLLSFAATLLILSYCFARRSSFVLLFLPPLVLLAVPGLAALRRGAANAFDWFSIVMFTFLAAVAWVAWSALVFGWPARLARQAVRLEPGFVGRFSLLACVFAVAVTLMWFALISTTPRQPMRGIVHWMAGLTLFWMLVAVLWMPWIDYGKSYRPVADALAKALPAKFRCIASANVPKFFLANIDYFHGIQPLPVGSEAGARCDLLLVHGGAQEAANMASMGWKKLLEDKRPSDRHDDDIYRLYQRRPRAKSAAGVLPVIEAGGESPGPDEEQWPK